MGRGRAPCCQKVGLNRGSWTPEEDMRLVAHIQKHGHGNWRALPKQAGLLRCGKSCRLRWINYLRPDIKRGNFTAEEEGTIIKLHGLLGNKWSKIASNLPGRTDNEIKNVWNTHLKKRVEGDNYQEPKKKKKSPTSPMDHPSSPSADISCDDKPMNVSTTDHQEAEKVVEISVIEPSMDVIRMLEDSLDIEPPPPPPPPKISPSSSSSTTSSSTSGNGMDMILGEIPELWDAIHNVFSSDVGVTEEAAGGGHEGSGRWLADLERELDLWGEVGHTGDVDQWDEREVDIDPVLTYFRTPSCFVSLSF